ncbi:MAG: hydroxyacid dehydrogenase [Methylibium sp.]|jgi:FAD/FMN-containing dehydrogenase|nr:hydroxyacid dehydrogenase [Methylibium sp.]MBY0366682.1 FAD-binding oxidoreductase [Burkholderiaceae bacterium]|mmetsp:Transcript_21961/g.86176  ORF Transcript_21961/g.86176 Transcript_21961/m.86176 type:complete len:468 (-) Transcript_21961:3045-4448(-)
MSDLLPALRALLGEAGLLVGGDLSAFERDWRGRYPGRALAVARPASTDEVAAVMRLCHAHRVPVVPQGGNTGLVGASTPDDSGRQLVLSLGRMRRVRAVDPANASLTAEAGCVLAEVQQAAAAAGLLFPLSLAAEGSCTLGGNLATNAGGTQVLRYGNARDLCLGLEVVTANGEVWHGLSGLRKDNTGYDLRGLFIGSEGTLGIITAATLKLFPAPAARFTALAACPSLDAAVELLGLARARAGDALTGFEVMNHASRALVARQLPQLQQPLANAAWTVLLELSDAEGSEHAQQLLEALLGTALERGGVQDAAVAQSLQQAQAFWQLREAIPLAQAQAGLNIKHDIALPVSEIAGFIAEMDGTLAAYLPGIEVIDFGHLGDGNLHYNVQAPAGVAPAEFLATHETAINAMVHDAVQRRGGSISAEHGIGRLKRDELARRKDPTALALMRAIKQALDPLGIMNPGRVL